MAKLFNFKEEHFLTLVRQKIPLDCIFLLEMIDNKQDVDVEEYLPFLQRLQRKGYLDGKQELTKYGEELLDSFRKQDIVVKPKRVRVKNDDFDKWWDVYPATNDFEINGKHFQGTQKKNIKKEECKKLFDVLCAKYPAEDIIRATWYHVQTAKEISYKKKQNQIDYIPNSERYLREKYFEPYIEKSKREHPSVKTTNDHEI